MITMRTYRIHYFAPCNVNVRDVFIENKGKYNVGWVEEFSNNHVRFSI